MAQDVAYADGSERLSAAYWALLLYCTLFVVPVRWETQLTTVGLLDVFILGLAGYLLWHHDTVLKLLLRTPATFPFLIYLAVVMLSLAVARDGADFLKEIAKTVQAFVLYVGFAVLVWRHQQPRLYERSVWIWTSTFFVIVVIAVVWQYHFIRTVPIPNIITDPETSARYFRFGWGPFALSNYFAGMLLVLIPVLWYRLSAWRSLRPIHAFMIGVALFVFLTALAFTFSRGAVAAFAAGLLLMALDRAPGQRLRILLLLLAVGLGVVFIITVPLGRRLIDFAGRSIVQITNDRIFIWQEALGTVQERPLLGVGFGNYAVRLSEQPWAHNFILQALVETGVIGALAYGGFLAGVGWTLLRVRSATRQSSDWWVFHGMWAAFAIMLLHNLVENTLIGVLYLFLFWPIQALGLARYWQEENIPA